MEKTISQKLDVFFSKYNLLEYKRGQVLIKADESPAGIFFLKKGIVRRYAVSAKGEEFVLNLFRPISFFPMEYVINNTISHHYFESMTPVLIYMAPKEDFLEFIKKNQDILLNLVSRIYLGMEGLFQRMEYLMAGNANYRLIVELLIFAKRFGKEQGSNILIDFKLTERDLASQTGIARETVSREIHKLIKKGLLSYKKSSLVIINLQKLEEELQSEV